MHILFQNGSYSIFKVSQHVNLEVNREYLASRNISLVSTGPSSTKSVKLYIGTSSTSFMAVLVFFLQYIIVVGMALGIVMILIAWERSRPQLCDKADLDIVESNKSGVDEQLIANRGVILEENDEDDLALDVKNDGFGYRDSFMTESNAIDMNTSPQPVHDDQFIEVDSLNEDDNK